MKKLKLLKMVMISSLLLFKNTYAVENLEEPTKSNRTTKKLEQKSKKPKEKKLSKNQELSQAMMKVDDSYLEVAQIASKMVVFRRELIKLNIPDVNNKHEIQFKQPNIWLLKFRGKANAEEINLIFNLLNGHCQGTDSKYDLDLRILSENLKEAQIEGVLRSANISALHLGTLDIDDASLKNFLSETLQTKRLDSLEIKSNNISMLGTSYLTDYVKRNNLAVWNNIGNPMSFLQFNNLLKHLIDLSLQLNKVYVSLAPIPGVSEIDQKTLIDKKLPEALTTLSKCHKHINIYLDANDIAVYFLSFMIDKEYNSALVTFYFTYTDPKKLKQDIEECISTNKNLPIYIQQSLISGVAEHVKVASEFLEKNISMNFDAEQLALKVELSDQINEKLKELIGKDLIDFMPQNVSVIITTKK